MVNRTQQIGRLTKTAGLVALAIVLSALLGPLIALSLKSEGWGGISSTDWSAIRFTIWQALLSALISVLLAIPVARALARRQFWGRSVLITFLGAPFLLPVIVAVFGLLAIWGRSGVVSQMLMGAGFERISIYGLTGILLAHVFFNLPLATRLILQGWSSIPAEHFRLAAQLGMSARNVRRQLEWPMLKSVIPGAFLLIFLLCITSFAVVLALGGGPKSTTIELAIYQAVRFNFDFGKAASLGVIQFIICAGVALISLKVSINADFGNTLGAVPGRWDARSKRLVLLDFLVISFVMLFLGTPLISIILRGLPGLFTLPPSTWGAIANSLKVAFLSTALAIGLALSLAVFIDKLKARASPLAGISEGLGLLTLSISPFVLGTGLFVLLYPITNPFAIALPVTALVNTMISLPFSLRSLLPALEQNRRTQARLSDSLGIKGWARFRIVIWPAIRQPLGFSAGLAAAFSMGDLGVITMFAPPDVETLPLLMYRLMGAYRMAEAASVALILISITLFLFWVFDQGGRYGNRL